MKIKQISATIRKSYNYNSFECGMTADLEENDEEIKCYKLLSDKCVKLVDEKLEEYKRTLTKN